MFKEIETFISKKKRASVCVGGGRGGGGEGVKEKTEKKIPAKTNNRTSSIC